MHPADHFPFTESQESDDTQNRRKNDADPDHDPDDRPQRSEEQIAVVVHQIEQFRHHARPTPIQPFIGPSIAVEG